MMAENNGGNIGDQQGGQDASDGTGTANKEVLAALNGINEQLKSNDANATKLSTEDKVLYQALLDEQDSNLQQEEPDDIQLDDPKVRKALALQEKQFEAKLAALEKKAQVAADTNMQANVNAQVDKEIQQAYDTYGDVLKTNWDEVQAVVDRVPALTVSEALELVLAPARSQRLSAIDNKTRKDNERKAGAGIGGGVDIGALTADLKVGSHAEAAEKMLDRIIAQGGQL